MKSYRTLSIAIFVMFLSVSTGHASQSLNLDRNSIVARVDRGSISLDQVLELWGPSYYEVINNVRSGKIPYTDVNSLLQKEWTKALDSTIRDEAFYQESLNDSDNKFQKMVDSYYAAQRASGATRTSIENRLKKMMKKNQDAHIKNVINSQIKAAGGVNNLNSVLRSRGITYEQWKNRIIRKAFTYNYLFSVFEPLGTPIEPRPQQILKYYKKNIKDFTVPGNVIFDHILISFESRGGKKNADNIAQQIGIGILDKKISFANAAAKYSDDKAGAEKHGRETGVSPDPEREAWLGDVREAVKVQKIDELEILESPKGFHITVLRKLNKGKRIPFKKAQKMIIDKIKNDKWEKQSNEFYKKLKNKINIEVLQPHVPDALLWNEGIPAKKTRKIGMSADPSINDR